MTTNQARDVVRVESTWTKAARTKDRGVTITVKSAKEVSSDDYLKMDRLLEGGQGCNGWFVFIPNTISREEAASLELPKENAAIERGQKTASQRLRAVLFVRWTQLGSKGDFEDYYRSEMNYIIGEYKALLDEAS